MGIFSVGTTLVTGTTLVAGMLFGLSLIVAIGPQNVYLLRQGVLRTHIGAVVAICTLSDIVLIAAGVAGAGAVIGSNHWALAVVRIGGALFLLGYAALAARRAFRPASTKPGVTAGGSLWAVVRTCLAFTWLNPSVYLDTVVVLGPVANAHAGHRWDFGVGAMLGSVLWFVAVGYGARLFSPLLSRPAGWRLLDGFVAAVMTFTAVRLLAGA